MQHPRVRPRSSQPDACGVYVSLDALVRLQFLAQGFSFLPRQPVHSVLSGRRASRLRGRGLNFEELRRYLPGDDVRTIDWRVTARTGKPHVRVFTEERDRPVLFVVDQRQSMFFGSQRALKSVAAAEAAALGAWRVLGAGDRVGGVVIGDEELRVVRPHRSKERVMRLLKAVVAENHSLKADAGSGDPSALDRGLERVARLVKHDALVVVVSDFAGAGPETLRAITRMAAHNDVLLAFIHDPLEVALPDAGPLVMGERELQLEVDTGDGDLRRSYANAFEERLARVRRLARQREVPVLAISTAKPVAEQVREALGHRAQRRSW
jgi:uncharacterized protein (DUF58 family)